MSVFAEQNPDLVVFDAPEPHECVVSGGYRPMMNPGSILRCSCGRYWHLVKAFDGDGYRWRRVRWWHFEARARIRHNPMSARLLKRHAGELYC